MPAALLVLPLLLAGRAEAQVRPAAADTLDQRSRQLARLAGFPTPPYLLETSLPGQVPDAELDFGLGGTGAIWPIDLGGFARQDARQLTLVSDPGAWARQWDRATVARFRARADTLWLATLSPPRIRPNYFAVTRVVRTDSAGVVTVEETPALQLPGALGGFADLEIEVEGQGQLRARWESFNPCLLGFGQTCNPSAIPNITPEFQLRALITGAISERVFVNVDFDQTREFDATNNLNVYYRGLADEIIEFIEVGDVSLALPRSSFISQGIPSGNFGGRGLARVGPMDLQMVVAQQSGNIQDRQITLDVGGGQEGIVQELELVLDDTKYQAGQFFLLVRPEFITGSPFFNVLTLLGTEVPDSIRPTSSIKLYRHEQARGQLPGNVESGVIQANAFSVSADGQDTAIFRGSFRPLVEGTDFIVHKSGLWVVIRSAIQREEALALTYISVRGDTIGDFDAEEIFRNVSNTGQGQLPSLSLLKDASFHRPGNPTWLHELHNIYRISGGEEVEEGSVNLVISQGPIESGPVVRQAAGQDLTFLEIFGLDLSPQDDRVDDGRVWRPANSGDFAGNTVISGTYLVFGALEPFKDPPPIPNLNNQPFPLAQNDRNFRIYDDPNDLIRTSTTIYRLNVDYRSRQSGQVTAFSIGAFGIRPGSEKVSLNGIELVRDEDYTIDYDIGRLNLLRPNELLGSLSNPQLSIRFEEQELFDLNPRTIIGLTGGFQMGEWGKLNFLGLSQTERSVVTRPEIGLEPAGLQLGGVTLDVPRISLPGLTSVLNSLPGVETDRESLLTFGGEFAASSPTTNRTGITYVDDFEGSSGTPISMRGRAFKFGAEPPNPLSGGNTYLPAVLDASNILDMVWQSQWTLPDGQVLGSLLPQEIDPQIQTAGATNRETVLWMQVTNPPATESGWYSITANLSQTGLDLSNTEALQFYASTQGNDDPSIALIIDIGVVSEDAFVLDSTGIPFGLGDLNQEVDPIVGVWGNQDDNGLWSRGCESIPGATFTLGDPRAQCYNQNGLEDSEDLNRNQFLDTDERYFRFIVPLNVDSRFLNRPTGVNGFKLYTLPLVLPDVIEGLTAQGLQNVKHLRITVASGTETLITLSLMELTGSRYIKQDGTGSVAGFVGTQSGAAGLVSVGTISTLDSRYVSPPGIFSQSGELTDQLSLGGVTINEQSLRLAFESVPAQERIEVFRRYAATTQDFLVYRRMLLWVLAAQGSFGINSPLRFYIRLGNDDTNFYHFQRRLRAPPADGVFTQADWRPERQINFNRWIQLRAFAEEIILAAGGNLPGDTVLTVWDVDVFPDGDSTYAVVIGDRSRAPNLSAIRELTLGVLNPSDTRVGPGEIWIDDIRLDRPTDDNGFGTRAEVALAGSDVLAIRATYNRRDPFFRQLGDVPTYKTDWAFTSSGVFRIDRFLPSRWGVSVPFEASHLRGISSPVFLPQTDVLAQGIDSLRTQEDRRTAFGVGFQKVTASRNGIMRSTLDGLRLGYNWSKATRRATLSQSKATTWSLEADWARTIADRSFPLLPNFMRKWIDGLPGFMRNSELFQNLRDLRFRWTPRSLALGMGLADATTATKRFNSVQLRPADRGVTPFRRLSYNLSPVGAIQLQPFPTLGAGLRVTSLRDLVPPSDQKLTNTVRELVIAERGTFLGLNVGWQTAQNITANYFWSPRLAKWFDVDLAIATGFSTGRSLSYVDVGEIDTTLVRDMRSQRNIDLDIGIRPPQFLDLFGVPQADAATGFQAALRDIWDRFGNLQLRWGRVVNASYDRQNVSPSLSDKLVWGSLNSLRISGPDTASSAGSNYRFSVGGGYQLPLSLDADIRYSSLTTAVITVRSDRNSSETEWPNVSLRWRDIPLPGFSQGLINQFSLTGNYRRFERSEQTTTQQNFGEKTNGYGASFLLVFPNGFNLNYRYDRTDTNLTDATGVTGRLLNGHEIRATGTIRPGPSWGFLSRSLRVALEYTKNGNTDCRSLGGFGFDPNVPTLPGQGLPDDCTPHIDQLTQHAALTIDSDWVNYSVGIQFSWDRRSSAVGSMQRVNQFNLNIFGRFTFLSSTFGPQTQTLP